ncbi:ABC transporter ATP-binding protein [Desulfogranum japonicum]|uniref:ABC transporter ATP-binding protein n=1 Tax=Desulfogranum japonicum TaxID=231447 RepID=UPI00041AA47F|nr:ABC transporter ATP-binding protein [Desulfogranum japonicum]
MNSNTLLQATEVSKSYRNGDNIITVLNGVNLTLLKREMVAIVGASGSGKTTLLQILGTLDTADHGSILFKGQELHQQPEASLAAHRNSNIGFIFQFHHLLPEFTALENIMMPGLIQGQNKAILRDRAMELLQRIQLAKRADHRSGELSGGEQQRIALARALILQPALLLADEPTGNLDAGSGQMVFELLQELSDSFDLSVLMVTHNMELAQALDRTLTLESGHLV